MILLLSLACAPLVRPNGAASLVDSAAALSGGPVLFTGGTVVGVGRVDLLIDAGKVAAVGPDLVAPDAAIVDVHGSFLVPAFIDSHVHLAYLPEGEALADGGIAGAVDLAAPLGFLAADHAPLQVLASGPMVTAEGGYPTRSWGSAGYGLECADAAEAVAAVDTLRDAGAGVLKLPVTGEPQLDAAALTAAAARARGFGWHVVSHALGDEEAALAAASGVDVLAHTPTGALSRATLDAWRHGAVVSTLTAFGGSGTTLANLAGLWGAGATVLYGTDFGNTRAPGIDPDELLLLQAAGLSNAEVIAAGTSVPASFWGFADLGSLEVGKSASFLVLANDPLVSLESLTLPQQVWIAGVRRAR